MAGEVNDSEILIYANQKGDDLSELKELIDSGKSFEDEKKKISVEKKRIKDQIDQIPSRLDEIDRTKPESQNWTEIEKQIEDLTVEIVMQNNKIDSVNSSIQAQKDHIVKLQKEKFEKEQNLDRLARKQFEEINNERAKKDDSLILLNNAIKEGERIINESNRKIESLTREISELETKNNKLREDYKSINEQTFVMDAKECVCPTCKRDLDNAEQIETELRSNFNSDKLSKLETINANGKANAEKITELKSEIEIESKKGSEAQEKNKEIQAQIETLKNSFGSIPLTLDPTDEMKQLKAEIDAIDIPEIYIESIEETRNKISEIGKQIDELKQTLSQRSLIDSLEKRSEQLKGEQRQLAQELASFEKIEIQIDRFNKSKIELVESRINAKFSIVKFKMFDQQINGGEAPACECLVDGVPYSSLNTARKINASIDIINAFQYHYGIFAPVFIDGRESVTSLIKTNCQMISLIVDPSSEKISVVNA
jgi:DNA repair exonuclease SbcCD ATPase subunit